MLSTESIIRQYVSFPSRASSKGWHTVKCRVCNDYKKRAGFIFQSPTSIGYNCFNCHHETKMDFETNSSIPSKMQEVFDAFGIDDIEIKEELFKRYVARGGQTLVLAQKEVSPIKYNDLKKPPYFRKLVTDGSGTIWDELACEYLLTERSIHPTDYPFMIAEESKCSKEIYAAWKGRVIIPYYRHDDLIFYQGRDIINSDRTKYLSPPDSRDACFYGFDEIYAHTDKPLFIHEGFFDAFLLKDSVATFSNKLSDNQIIILNKCPRPKIVIPDRQGDGGIIAKQAIAQGWGVSFPDIGSDCKDINDAISKYGRLYVVKSINENIKTGYSAEIATSVYCK